jgi:hypothetical protein
MTSWIGALIFLAISGTAGFLWFLYLKVELLKARCAETEKKCDQLQSEFIKQAISARPDQPKPKEIDPARSWQEQRQRAEQGR